MAIPSGRIARALVDWNDLTAVCLLLLVRPRLTFLPARIGDVDSVSSSLTPSTPIFGRAKLMNPVGNIVAATLGRILRPSKIGEPCWEHRCCNPLLQPTRHIFSRAKFVNPGGNTVAATLSLTSQLHATFVS